MDKYIPTLILLFIIPGSLLYTIPVQVYPQAQFNPNNQRSPRLSLAEEYNSYNYREHNGPGTFSFGYDIDDAKTGNSQFREEERHPNGTVTGSYGYVEPDGNLHVVHYVADEKGYRVRIENSRDHPSVAGPKLPITNNRYQPNRPQNNYQNTNMYNQRTNYVNPVIIPSNDLRAPILPPQNQNALYYNPYYASNPSYYK